MRRNRGFAFSQCAQLSPPSRTFLEPALTLSSSRSRPQDGGRPGAPHPRLRHVGHAWRQAPGNAMTGEVARGGGAHRVDKVDEGGDGACRSVPRTLARDGCRGDWARAARVESSEESGLEVLVPAQQAAHLSTFALTGFAVLRCGSAAGAFLNGGGSACRRASPESSTSRPSFSLDSGPRSTRSWSSSLLTLRAQPPIGR